MHYNPNKHHRKSIRVPGYDYSSQGWYFVTICVKNRRCIFGNVVDKKMILNENGEIVTKEWNNNIIIRDNISIDEFIVMPNHIHGIIVINNNVKKINAGAYCDKPLQLVFRSPSKTIGSIIRGFKSAVTKRINIIRNTPGIPVWQRNYYEHIIRDEDDLNRIRLYIIENPLKWTHDKYYE